MLIPDQVDILPDHYDSNCDSRIGAQRGRGCGSIYMYIYNTGEAIQRSPMYLYV